MVLDLTDNAMHVLASRYLAKDGSRVVETPEQMFTRVAANVAESERLYGASESEVEALAQEFYDLMASLDFLPNSPTLMNAGRGLQQLAACFVLPIDDSIKSIFESITNTALIHQSGGGTGFSFSRLRPKGDVVRSTGGTASGPVSFMKVFNAATEVVKQGGKRRGANMGILRVDHPDIEEFIACKEKGKDLANFNISVALTPVFLAALDEDAEYDLVNPRSGEVVKRLSARMIFDLIVEMAWRTGDPGIVFLDRLNQDNPTPALGEIESTNPCGEQPLLPYEACNLGSVNLAHVTTAESRGGSGEAQADRADAKAGCEAPGIDWGHLERVVRLSVRFLDDVIDAGKYPLEQIDRMVKGNRKVGLGVMGFADMLIDLGVAYDSDRAVEVGESVMSFIQRVARDESCRLARERGPFPNFPGSTYDRPGCDLRPRNATCTTVAPTGSLSVIANCSSGIEPLFAVAYVRHVLDTELVEVNPRFEAMARDMGFHSPELMARVAEHGTVRNLPEVPEDVKRLFVTAHDINPDYHIRIQAAFQKYTDNAVSKTVNLRTDAPREDVDRVFRLARALGCKGVTIYRDKSKDTQVLTAGLDKGEAAKGEAAEAGRPAPSWAGGGAVARPRPKITHGTTEKVKVGCGSLYVSVNSDDVGLCEIFTNTGREGGCPSQSEATSRLISIALRSGVEVGELLGQLKGIRCLACIRRKDVEVKSCPDAIGRAVERYLRTHPARVSPAGPAAGTGGRGAAPAGSPLEPGPRAAADDDDDIGPNNHIEKGDPMDSSPGFVNSTCPECGEQMWHEGGCIVCRSCGFSRCD